MIRQIFKTGNSIVISLPREVLEGLGVKNGESVNLELDRKQRRLIVYPIKKHEEAEGIDPAFAKQVNDFIEKYRSALNELAK